VSLDCVTSALYSPIQDGWIDKKRYYKDFKDICTPEIEANIMPKIDRFFHNVNSKKHNLFGEIKGKGFKESKLLYSWEKLYFSLGINRMLEGL
jgi:hypothetical protein